MTGRYPRLLALLAATSFVTVISCGESVPTKEEAAGVLSKAIESTLTRTLPAATYCMTANPDFSFANVGQLGLVETFQNLKDKSALYDASTAGALHIDLKEFRFDPVGRSPDPSCDAVHAQSRKSGLTSRQVRLAMVRMALTPKATAAGVQLDTPIEVATRELVEVSDVRRERGGAAVVTYTWRWKTTTMAASQSWQITPSLETIQAVMKEIGAPKTVLAIYFRNPYVLDDESRLKEAGAILASFGVSDTALLEVISGRFKPRGRLPFALARTLHAVIDNQPDVPGYRAADTLYPFKFGLTY